MKAVLDIRGLTVALPPGAERAHAIEQLDLMVATREIVCLVGESGSGKSVAALSVMGLLPSQLKRRCSGEILLEGEDLLQARANRLRALRGSRMSMIFQEPMTALNPVITCGQQVEEALTVHGVSEKAARQRMLSVLEQVHLPDPSAIAAAYPHQLSGGQRQRIMIAMALVLEPVLLIADEPTTALDVTTQAQILSLIKEIQCDHETGVLFITHDFGVVAEIADRVAVMLGGRIVEVGSAEQVLRQPSHAYTRMLIDAVPDLVPHDRSRSVTGSTVIATKSLSKTYGSTGFFQTKRRVNAVDDVSLRLRQGETLGIVGESGSGKSTVARCLARLIEPSAGEIDLAGTDIARMPARRLRNHRRKIQIVFQDPYRSLNPRRRVGASIIEGPLNYGLSREEALARARALMEVVHLDSGALDRFPHQFSGGQRQRICIARALAMEPQVLIADEAVSALDVSVQARVLALFDEIRNRLNLAMLFITHDLRVAAQICDSIAVMQHGKIVEYGDVERVFLDPQHDYTRSLFNAAPGRHFDFARRLR